MRILARGAVRAAALAAGAALAMALPAMASAQGSTSISAGTYTVSAGTTHQGNIRMGVGTVVVRGTQIGNVSVGMGAIEVSGIVTGGVQVGMGQLVLTHSARVEGKVSVGAGQTVRLSPGQALPTPGNDHLTTSVGYNLAGVGPWSALGHLPRMGVLGPLAGVGLGLAIVGRVAWWLLSVAVAFVLLSLFPEPTRRIAQDIEDAPGPVLGWGLLVALAAGPASILLAITILGIPLAMLLGLALLAAKVMGYVAVSLLLGARLLPHLGVARAVVGWELVAGSVLLLLVGSIPLLGVLVSIVVALIGIGACGRTGFGTGRPWFRAPPPAPAS